MTNLSVEENNGILIVDSRLVASQLGIQHRSFFQKVILKYQDEIEEDWVVIRFEIAKPLEGSRGGRPERYAFLTEQQAYLTLTYSKNTAQARHCKRELVKAFDRAKQVIKETLPAQANRIRELELELQVAQAQQAAAAAQHQATTAQNQLVASCSALAIINPALPALVLGKPDAVMTHREIVQETVLVNAQGKAIASYLGYSKTKLAKRYGMKKPQDLVNWLRSVGRADILQPGLTATPCQYVPYELVPELDVLWMQHRGMRQRLIGE